MAMKLYRETDIRAIADGIRNLTGETGTYTVAQMGSALNDYWGDSTLAMSGVNADGTPFTQSDNHRWGTSSLIETSENIYVKYCSGFIELPAGATLRIWSSGTISAFFVNTEKTITTDTTRGYNLGAAVATDIQLNSLIYKNNRTSSLWVRINSTVPMSEVKMKVVSE